MSLDIERAYHNSLILPRHKAYLASFWEGSIYVGHVAVEGLATAGGIQGCLANAMLNILCHRGIPDVFKWVDDIVIFQLPIASSFDARSSSGDQFSYSIDLQYFFNVTSPLGIPWHPINKKGQDFAPSVKYVGFLWDVSSRQVLLTNKKHTKLLAKLDSFLSSPHLKATHWECASLHGSLQHVTFVYKDSHSVLLPLSAFISKFKNDHTRLHIPGSVEKY